MYNYGNLRLSYRRMNEMQTSVAHNLDKWLCVFVKRVQRSLKHVELDYGKKNDISESQFLWKS